MGKFLGGMQKKYIIVIDTFADLTSSIFYLFYLGGPMNSFLKNSVFDKKYLTGKLKLFFCWIYFCYLIPY